MRFYKYEGIGNDFIVIDGIRDHASIDADLCRRMCDRNFGIGADGILFVLPGQDGSDITMRILNSDGSEAIMCGNGIRCVAKFAYDNGLVKKRSFVVNTLRGNLGADVTVIDGKVDMKALSDYAIKKGEVTDSLSSGRQELLESIVNNVLFSL